MGKVYLSNPLDIQLTASNDITSASALLVAYRTPQGTEGTLTATEVTASTGVIRHQGSAAETYKALADEQGNWRFWTKITFSDGRTFEGEPHTEPIGPSGG